MHDFMCSDYQDMHYEILRNEVRYFKETEGGEQKMCEIMEEIERNGERRGEIKGLSRRLKRLLKRKVGNISPEIMLQIDNSTLEQLDQLTDSLFTIETEEDILKALTC